MMQAMLNIAKKFMAEQLNMPLERIHDDTTFAEMKANSNDVMEIIRVLEDIYDIDFPDDLEYDPCLGNMVELLYAYWRQVKR